MSNITTSNQNGVSLRDLPIVPAEEAFERSLERLKASHIILWQAFNGWEGYHLRHHKAVELLADTRAFFEGDFQTVSTQMAAIARPATRREIAEHCAILVGCMTVSKVNPAVFTKMLAIDVGAAQPSIAALESGCRRLRRTATFLSIAEVITTIAEAEKSFSDARSRLQRLPDLVAQIDGKMAQEEHYRLTMAARETGKATG